ncbi:uncharacterized protein cdkn1cb [Leuresthes tenuis]|uniref:uncharacterized protein cdkn1cb n=1 Tax=Leuresthes tenuis TaxID=355514 RepID=UPI003B50D917
MRTSRHVGRLYMPVLATQGTFKHSCEGKGPERDRRGDTHSYSHNTTTLQFCQIRNRTVGPPLVIVWLFFLVIVLEMSHVQLSCSALERLVARRTFPLHRRTSVCRNLFGPVDHDELSRDVKAKLREISDRDQQRWNFNFEANTPLDGDYEWEEVPVDKTPAFYQESAPNERSRVPATPVKQRPSSDSPLPETPQADVLERLAAPESSSGPCPVEVNQENRTDKLNSGTQTQAPCVRHKTTAPADSNTHIPDFFVKRKRAADRKSNDMSASCHLSKSPIPLEQTPRKRIR